MLTIVFVSTLFCSLFFFAFTSAQLTQDQPVDARFTQNFLGKLDDVHININDIQTQSEISRYELARLLNLVDCQDCVEYPPRMQDKYTPKFRQTFTRLPGRDFEDIVFEQARDNETSYYYCVAYVGDNEYMRGYPAKTSPVCAGDFCGTKSVTKAEFMQVIINLVEKYLYNSYTADRKDIADWAQNLSAGTYEGDVLTDEDTRTITDALADCETNCTLQSRYEFETYLKYCMFNLEACDFHPFGRIKETYRPVSELNIMETQHLLPINDVPQEDIHQPVDGGYVLAVIGRLHKKINCSFDTDYDCDDVPNWNDNCVRMYNPHQRDLDEDSIGNVCDDDIDGGGQTHLIGIVDDDNNLVAEKYRLGLEDDVLSADDDIGENQGNDADVQNTGSGDDASLYFSSVYYTTVDVVAKQIKEQSFRFKTNIHGARSTIHRDMGDGTQYPGDQITDHTYTQPGRYTVTVTVQNEREKAIAITSIEIPAQATDEFGIEVSPTFAMEDLQQNLPLALHFQSTQTESKGTKTTWYVNDEQVQVNSSSLSHTFAKYEPYKITTTTINQAGDMIGVSQISLDFTLLGSRVSWLATDALSLEQKDSIIVHTKGYGRDEKDIDRIVRNMGEDKEKTNNKLTMSHQYEDLGQYVIVQNIFFKDGSQHANFLTVFVEPTTVQTQQYVHLTVPHRDLFVHEPLEVQITLVDVDANNVLDAMLYRGDGQSTPLEFENGTAKLSYTYINAGRMQPYTMITLKDCKMLHAQASMYIQKQNDYENALKNGTLQEEFFCDMDGDDIPDIADSDIDGDGVPNQLGLIIKEDPRCKQNPSLFVKKSGVDGQDNEEFMYPQHIYDTKRVQQHKGVCSLDNCPLIVNTDQKDIDVNGVGDVCRGIPGNPSPDKEKFIPTEPSVLGSDEGILEEQPQNQEEDGPEPALLDDDQDGIPNAQDVCPLIKENINEKEDTDGCPEIGEDDPCATTFDPFDAQLQAGTCTTCPCQFADFGGELLLTDTVRAVLMDTGGNYEYTRSFEQKVP